MQLISYIRVALFFSKVRVMGVIWEILYPETAVQKDFSQKSMVSPENAFRKIPLKVHYLGNEQELKKFDPPWNWKLMGVYFLQLFKILTYCGVKWIFLIFLVFFPRHFLVKPLTSVKNPFTQQFLGIISLIWPPWPILLRKKSNPSV